MDGENIEAQGDEGAEQQGQRQESGSQGQEPAAVTPRGKHAAGSQDDGGEPSFDASAYEAQIAERDTRIAELEAQVAEAARNAEAADELRGQIAELKAQGEEENARIGQMLMSGAGAVDVLERLRDVTNRMDEAQVSTGSRYLFITPTLKGVLDDYSYANPTRSNRVLERFARIVEVPQVRFYTSIDLLSGEGDRFGYQKSKGVYVPNTDTEVDNDEVYFALVDGEYVVVDEPKKADLASYYKMEELPGRAINFLVVEKSAVIKFDKHVASRVFSPDELESLDSYMMKYRKYGIVELLDNKLDGVYVSTATA